MAEEDDSDVPDTGAAFCFGKSQFADNQPGKFWIREDIVLHVACGDEHTALVTASGRVFTFGSNEWGQLGQGHTKTLNKPTCVKALKHARVILIACGRSHTLVATDSGSVYGFGSNGEGQLENSGEDVHTTPIHIQGLEGLAIKSLCGGADHSMALTDKGILYVWGGNSEGQLGLTEKSQYSIPTELKFDVAVICISAGYYHSAAITGDGKLYTFGETERGKLGLSETSLKKLPKPQLVSGLSGKAVWVSCGGNHTISLTADGTAYCFGDNSNGQLGIGTKILEAGLPEHLIFPNNLKIARVSCGENHTAFLADNGQVYTCGDDRHGKLGLLREDGSYNKFEPALITRIQYFQAQQVSCGGCHSVVVAAKLKTTNDIINKEIPESHVAVNSPDVASDARQRRRQRNKLPPLSHPINAKVTTQQNGSSNPLNRTKLPSIGENNKDIMVEEDMSESEDESVTSGKRRSMLEEAQEDENIRHADSDLESETSEISELNKTHGLVIMEDNESQLKPLKDEDLRETGNQVQEENLNSHQQQVVSNVEHPEKANDGIGRKSSNSTTDGHNKIETLSEHIIEAPKEKESSKRLSWFTLRRGENKDLATTMKSTTANKEKQASRLSLFKAKETVSSEKSKDDNPDEGKNLSKKRSTLEKNKKNTLTRETHSQSPGTTSHKSKACVIL